MAMDDNATYFVTAQYAEQPQQNDINAFIYFSTASSTPVWTYNTNSNISTTVDASIMDSNKYVIGGASNMIYRWYGTQPPQNPFDTYTADGTIAEVSSDYTGHISAAVDDEGYLYVFIDLDTDPDEIWRT